VDLFVERLELCLRESPQAPPRGLAKGPGARGGSKEGKYLTPDICAELENASLLPLEIPHGLLVHAALLAQCRSVSYA